MMNNDLISRSALLDDIDSDREAAKVHPQEMCERFNRFCDYAEELVKDAPAVDAEPVRQWISVKDAQPEKGVNVLFHPIYNPDSIYIGCINHVGEKGACYFEVRRGKYKTQYSATHWMPLPEPPKED